MKTGLFPGGSDTRKWGHLGLSAQQELLGTAEPSARGGALICHWVSCSGLWKVPWFVRGGREPRQARTRGGQELWSWLCLGLFLHIQNQGARTLGETLGQWMGYYKISRFSQGRTNTKNSEDLVRETDTTKPAQQIPACSMCCECDPGVGFSSYRV